MRTYLLVLVGAAVLILLVGMATGLGQPLPGQGKNSKEKSPKPKKPLDEDKEILDKIKTAYKDPSKVHADFLKELRKYYQQPTPDREAKIFKELRKLYQLTAEQEMDILQGIRLASARPSAEQEERILQLLSRVEQLPAGAVPVSAQIEQTKKLFVKLDRNSDGLLDLDEMPEALLREYAYWDTNRNGFIEVEEYWAYYQGRLQGLSEGVASGMIELKGKQGGSSGSVVPIPMDEVETEVRPAVYRAGSLLSGLPDFFLKLDTDRDIQLGLYEWKRSGRPLKEFFDMDRNDDGFLTIEELTRHLNQQPRH
jgi:hypothetical protein